MADAAPSSSTAEARRDGHGLKRHTGAHGTIVQVLCYTKISTTIEVNQEEEQKSMSTLDCLTRPYVLNYCDFHTLCQLFCVNKHCHTTLMNDKTSGFWQAICNSYAVERGLFSTHDVFFSGGTRKFFFDTLFPARAKWQTTDLAVQGEDETAVASVGGTQAFKVEVACRFRPGQRVSRKLVVPLHQFLKVIFVFFLSRKNGTKASVTNQIYIFDFRFVAKRLLIIKVLLLDNKIQMNFATQSSRL